MKFLPTSLEIRYSPSSINPIAVPTIENLFSFFEREQISKKRNNLLNLKLDLKLAYILLSNELSRRERNNINRRREPLPDELRRQVFPAGVGKLVDRALDVHRLSAN